MRLGCRLPVDASALPALDVVYVPINTYHLARFHGEGPSCRLAMNGYPNIAHLYEAH